MINQTNMKTRKKIPVDTPFEDRFWMYVEPGAPSECWIWQGSVNASGYGQMTVRGMHVPAHRASYELSKGHITKRNVCHSCGIRRCVNPAHLYQISQSDRMKALVAQGRGSALIMENVRRGEYTRAVKALKHKERLAKLRTCIQRVVGPIKISDEQLERFYQGNEFGFATGNTLHAGRQRDSAGRFL